MGGAALAGNRLPGRAVVRIDLRAACPRPGWPDPGGPTPSPGEQSLFDTDSGARIFGEGSYVEGGSNQEGNFKEREARPHGSRGSFDPLQLSIGVAGDGGAQPSTGAAGDGRMS